jgi:hypothetical protein
MRKILFGFFERRFYMNYTSIDELNQNKMKIAKKIYCESLKNDIFVCSSIATEHPKTKEILLQYPLNSSVTTPGGYTAVRQNLDLCLISRDIIKDWNHVDIFGYNLPYRIAEFWRIERKNRILASIKGIVKDSINNYNSDLVIDISKNISPLDISDDRYKAFINKNTIDDSLALLPNHYSEFKLVVLHPVVLANLKNLNLVQERKFLYSDVYCYKDSRYQFIQNEKLTMALEPFNYDSSIKSFTQHVPIYYTYILGTFAITIGNIYPKVPFEAHREKHSGNEGEIESICSRLECIIHPNGYNCNLDKTPTLKELEEPNNWTRRIDRKDIPLSVIISRG